MIIDDNITNLTVTKKALESEYLVTPVTSGKKALELLEKTLPSLILLDIEMPEMDGFEMIRHLKESDKTRDIPVLFLTAKDDFASELEGLRLGAADYVTKPFSIPLLLLRVNLHADMISMRREVSNYKTNLDIMVKEQTTDMAELQHAIIHTLSEMVESRDGCTGRHVARTQKYLEALTHSLRDSEYYREDLASMNLELFIESAQLHDIGKIAVPDNILQKPGKLTQEEYEVMKKHASDGAAAIQNAMTLTRAEEFLRYASAVAISHHEHWDGSGYPYGLKGEDIPLAGRLMAIADVYDALVSERPYKQPLTHDEAMRIIMDNSGTQFDPTLVEIFSQSSDRFRQITYNVDAPTV